MKIAYVTVSMPYDPMVSVNSAYVRNNPRLGHRKRVDQWLTMFKIKLNVARGSYGIPIGNVRMDITIHRSTRRGRKPDTSNFRKLPQDLAASVLGVDDNCFFGIDHPLVCSKNRMKDDEIRFEFTWECNDRTPFLYNPAHKMSMGPLNATLMRRYSIKEGEVCIGFGSAFCMLCSAAPEDCPVQFDPSVYVSDNCPCKSCRKECPCKGDDEAYEERCEAIKMWWGSKLASSTFSSKHWSK